MNELVLEVPTWAYKTREEEETGNGDIDMFDDDEGEKGNGDGLEDFFDIRPFDKSNNRRILQNKSSPNFEI